jgi:hypothetical protein
MVDDEEEWVRSCEVGQLTPYLVIALQNRIFIIPDVRKFFLDDSKVLSCVPPSLNLTLVF